MHKAVQISECAIPKVELNARANQLFLHVKSDIFIKTYTKFPRHIWSTGITLAFHDDNKTILNTVSVVKSYKQQAVFEMEVRSYYFISARRCLVNMQIFNHWHCPLFLVDVARYMCHLPRSGEDRNISHWEIEKLQKIFRTAKECFDYVTSFVMASFLNFKMVLIGRIEQCISPVHTVLRQRLEFILKEKFQCTKTGFQRCAMQISIAIKCA
ncbi:hypothetical protein T05_29 [Trichinella murrelli]|uniref:Uncharacterized protein n=1 Tax=Trichinella murrelli TaxID=144512 RepID=A0A0V0TYR9_9BILA|nr:hypothetical protein T05_29 [Trichinella murrelli]